MLSNLHLYNSTRAEPISDCQNRGCRITILTGIASVSHKLHVCLEGSDFCSGNPTSWFPRLATILPQNRYQSFADNLATLHNGPLIKLSPRSLELQ